MLTSITTAMGLTSHCAWSTAPIRPHWPRPSSTNAADNENRPADPNKIRQLDKEGFTSLSDRSGHTVRVIYVSLAQLDGMPNLPFDNFSQVVNHIDTYFNISPPRPTAFTKPPSCW